ncbi:hypothetical protein [Neorhizobium petrolearium]|uniref:hypothetical protein n=1 Tax=Neorhizobium petrolearium TaxID=515361 RepID=UPI003F14E038
MLDRCKAAALLVAILATPAIAQQGGTFTPDTSTMPGTDSGGPLGTQAVERPKNAMSNSVGKAGQDCQKMANTLSGERPATSNQQEQQPQKKCENP